MEKDKKYRVSILVNAARWSYHLGGVPETTFRMHVQIWERGQCVTSKSFDNLTSAQFVKARELQNRMVGKAIKPEYAVKW